MWPVWQIVFMFNAALCLQVYSFVIFYGFILVSGCLLSRIYCDLHSHTVIRHAVNNQNEGLQHSSYGS